ncbi:DUF3185 family protein [Noviherbaspirillum sp.]|uniref:DUF3185 family protein n=1 Tax=Noviherbaspirillum sp. TaxID=1926288 RepID=UPI002FDFFAA4
MIKALSLALLAAGIMVTIFGANEMNSFSSDVSRVLTGAPTDHSVWMIVGGVMLVVFGLAGLLQVTRKH